MKLFGFLKQEKTCAAVIVAAGASRRMGLDKIMVELGGKPVLAHTIGAFEHCEVIGQIVVVCRRELRETVEDMAAKYGFTKITAVVAGGDSRMASVQNGLKALTGRVGLVAIQDGARPLVTDKIITDAVARAVRCGAAAPAVPVKDTVKVVDGDGKVIDTPDRSALRAVQTPQVFDYDLLLAAWKKAEQEGIAYTDDCGAMEGLGKSVYLTEGSEENLKLTTPLDLILAEEILKRRENP